MVNVVDVPMMSRLLREVGIEQFLIGLTEYVEADFRRWPSFEKSARLAAHVPQGVVELMPTTDGELFGFKFVNGHPANTAIGKLTVTAFGALADMKTGYPLLICEMTVLTALRTAATSALAAKYLAPRTAKTMALIGTGAQAEFQALAFKAVNGIDTVRYYDSDGAAMDKFARNLQGYKGLNVYRAESIAEALQGAQVVTTATAMKARLPLLTAKIVKPGMHINAIGGDCPGKTEIADDVIREARVVVEYAPQTRIEGEIQSVGAEFPVTELWEIITGAKDGRQHETQVTLFDSVGFAIEDFAALRYVSMLLNTLSIQAAQPLLPSLQDPKDLFSLLKAN